jgi:hypothetical protein
MIAFLVVSISLCFLVILFPIEVESYFHPLAFSSSLGVSIINAWFLLSDNIPVIL